MGRKKSSIGCLFWTALVLLVLVVFLFNRGTIESVIEKTGLLTYIKRDKDKNTELVVERTEEPTETTTPDIEAETPPETDSDTADEPSAPGPEESEGISDPVAVVVAEEEEEEDSPAPPPEPSEKIRRSRLFFVHVDENGGVTLKGVVRPVYYIDSPLTDTLRSLLSGLSAEDVRDGLLSLVPEGTELRGIAIREGTAYIDFNESFRFNSFGGEGYKSQLQQIVYTATEFQTVKSVQFLVNGERISYLGPESPYIGDPLSRESL
jgi:spore germination protein GerM